MEFATADATMRGEMTATVTLTEAGHHLNTGCGTQREMSRLSRVAATSDGMMGNRIAFQNPLAR